MKLHLWQAGRQVFRAIWVFEEVGCVLPQAACRNWGHGVVKIKKPEAWLRVCKRKENRFNNQHSE